MASPAVVPKTRILHRIAPVEAGLVAKRQPVAAYRQLQCPGTCADSPLGGLHLKVAATAGVPPRVQWRADEKSARCNQNDWFAIHVTLTVNI